MFAICCERLPRRAQVCVQPVALGARVLRLHARLGELLRERLRCADGAREDATGMPARVFA